MIVDILKIAILCVVLGSVSIPASFGINSSPVIVWFGNALGSVFSAVVVIYIGNRITDDAFKKRMNKRRVSRKVVTVFDSGTNNQAVVRAGVSINKHGLKLFSLLCPIFPGVLISTAAVFLLGLDKKIYTRWMLTGVVFVSGAYVFGYWWFFVK